MLLGLKDVDQAEKDIRNMLLYCSFCNKNFWDKLMMHLLVSLFFTHVYFIMKQYNYC